jgi:hypothetical protein
MSDNTNIVAAAAVAALGSNVTTQDNDTTNTTNSTSVDNNDVLSHNDVLSNNTANIGNDSYDNIGNDNSNDDVAIDNVGNDNSDDDVAIGNDTLSNIGNDNSDDDVAIGNDTYDNDLEVDVSITDSFTTDICDSDWLDLENVNFDVVSLISSDGQAFSLTQVSEMSANSSIGSASVSSGGTWGMGADADGGHADGINSSAPDFGEAGEDGILEGNADASGTADFDAFNQNISMGANIQQNVINLNVVGQDLIDDNNA